MNKFKDLKVYRKSLTLTRVVREIVKRFPQEELFGLISQFKRAVDSIVLNIAEGAGNTSKREYARYLDFSIRSGFECLACLDIALENGFIDKVSYDRVSSDTNEVIAMLYGLKKSLLK